MVRSANRSSSVPADAGWGGRRCDALAAGDRLRCARVRAAARRETAPLDRDGPDRRYVLRIRRGVAKIISKYVRNVEATAELTSASVDNLKFLRDGKADLAFTVTPSLHDAYRGTGAFARLGRVPAAALAVLYVQPTHLVTFATKRIGSLLDLRGKVVSTGTPGSGTEEIALRILDAAGLDSAVGIRRHRLGLMQGAEALKDGKIDVFVWSSGLPNPAVLDLTTTFRTAGEAPADRRCSPDAATEIRLGHLPAGEHPARAYPGLDVDVPTVGVASLLVAERAMSESLAYEITRALFEHRNELAAIHPEARNLKPELASTGSPVPFHRGA